VQFPFLRLFLRFQVIFSVCCVPFGVVTYQYRVIRSRILPYNDLFAKGVACGLYLPPAKNISPDRTTGLHSDTMWYDRKCVVYHIGQIGVLGVRFLLLRPPVGYVWYPKCATNPHWVGVVIIKIWIYLPRVL
jgi:hypothetical protein